MTIRRLRCGYEVKIPVVPDRLLVLDCDSLKVARRLDKIGRLYERVVAHEVCQLVELEEAMRSLEVAGVKETMIYQRLAACATDQRPRK